MIALLDVNVLLAVIWLEHRHHAAAARWFAQNRSQGWATCPITEAGFVRLSVQPKVVDRVINMNEAWRVLELNSSDPDHVFWPQDYSINTILPEIRQRVAGHHQVTDALLLDLAIRKKGRLVTLDRGIAHLLASDSPHRSALELVPLTLS